jgi:hypothetical protein
MTIRRLNLRIQGFPESYASEPHLGDSMVIGEPRPPHHLPIPIHMTQPSSLSHPPPHHGPYVHLTASTTPSPIHHSQGPGAGPPPPHSYSPVSSLHNVPLPLNPNSGSPTPHHAPYHPGYPHSPPTAAVSHRERQHSSELVSPHESGSRDHDDQGSIYSGDRDGQPNEKEHDALDGSAGENANSDRLNENSTRLDISAVEGNEIASEKGDDDAFRRASRDVGVGGDDPGDEVEVFFEASTGSDGQSPRPATSFTLPTTESPDEAAVPPSPMKQ